MTTLIERTYKKAGEKKLIIKKVKITSEN